MNFEIGKKYRRRDNFPAKLICKFKSDYKGQCLAWLCEMPKGNCVPFWTMVDGRVPNKPGVENNRDIVSDIPIDDIDKSLGTLKVFEYEGRTCLGIGIEGDEDRTLADVWDKDYAKLFAAAPRLLEALKDARRALAMTVCPESINDASEIVSFVDAKQIELNARAAIAKATT